VTVVPGTDRTASEKGRDPHPTHAEKLSDVGARIACIAHELNAPVSLIAGSLANVEQYVAALIRYIHATDEAVRMDGRLAPRRAQPEIDYMLEHTPSLLRICAEGAQRLTHLVEQLKGYTRRTDAQAFRDTVDLPALLEAAVGLAAHGRDRLPTIVSELAPLPPLRGNADALSQAFVNVLGNAFDALGEQVDARVWISTGRMENGDGVEVHIRDNGPGIDAAARARIFEAFFTTKPRGAGLGLGLAITKEIVEDHAGSIEVNHPQAGGTEFVIRVPLSP